MNQAKIARNRIAITLINFMKEPWWLLRSNYSLKFE